MDEVPPNYLRLNNRVFEERPQLNDDIFRREFGVDCSFSDEDIKATLKPGEYVWSLAVNDMVTILYLYGLDENYHLLISRDGKDFGDTDTTLIKNKELMLPYDSLFDKEFHHLLVQELSPSHESVSYTHLTLPTKRIV